jgi:hypothetical protein
MIRVDVLEPDRHEHGLLPVKRLRDLFEGELRIVLRQADLGPSTGGLRS